MRLSIFVVEGQTEQVFVQKFLEKMVADGKFRVQLQMLQGGRIIELSTRGVPDADATHIIRVLNVQGDGAVNSYISENLKLMKAKGVDAVYGLRDRYTGTKKVTRPSVEKSNELVNSWKEQYGIEVGLTVAIEEVEAWFLLVPDFFQSFHITLTPDKIDSIVGFDLDACDVEAIPHPAGTIDKVLRTVGLKYRKRLADSYKIAESLDYETLYLEKLEDCGSLKQFVGQLARSLP